MKRFTFFIFCLAGFSLSAQDTIFNKNGTKVIAKVMEIGDLINYKKTNNSDDHVYSVEKRNVRAIRYSNGVLEEIKSSEGPTPVTRDTLPKRKSRQEKVFCVYTNVMQLVVREFVLGFETRIGSYLAVGVSVGRIIYDPTFDPLILSPSQNIWPGTVYDGYSLRTNFKIFPNKNRSGYWNLQGVYKSLSYRNRNFFDIYSHDADDYANYTRSEDAFVIGLSIIHGNEFNVAKGWLYLDVFYGVGFRVRERSIHTLSIGPNPQSADGFQVGYMHKEQTYPMLDVGFRIGLSIPKKQKPVAD